MVQLQSSQPTEILYPERDGNPMSDNTKQFRWIVTIKENLECLFADDANVFIAGDLLWYPIEGDNRTRVAPDAMVVIGRPNGDRFLTAVEMLTQKEAAIEQASRAEQRASSAEQRASSAEQRASSAEQRVESLAQKLRELGIDPEQV